MFQRCVSQDSSTTSRDLRHSGWGSHTHHRRQELLDYLDDFSSGDGRVHLSPRPLSSEASLRGSEVLALTGFGDLTATAPSGCVDNGSGKHGPLGLDVSSLSPDLFKVLPEVGFEVFPDRELGHTFSTDPVCLDLSLSKLPSLPKHPTYLRIFFGQMG